MRLIARLLICCLPLFSLSSEAATVSDLYQVREPVASQQPEERDAALGRALETLIQRLTGKADAAQSPALAQLRKEPQQVVSKYGYEGDALLVEFDSISTERALRQADFALWGANRPAILAWWLNDGSEGSSLVGDGQSAAQVLRQAAQYRGLPLRLPLADLEEQLLATPENLLAGEPDALRSASERYAADAQLAVLARESDGQWQAEWRLWLGDEREQGKAQGADQAALADALLLAVSQRLAPRFVVTPGAATNLTLEIQGVDLKRYAELQRLLEPFAAQLSKVQGETLTFQVKASAEQLRAQLALAQLHEVTEQAPVAESDAAAAPDGEPGPRILPRTDVLRFRW